MARIFTDVYPEVIIEIPESTFPDEITIVFEGVMLGAESKNRQIAIDTLDDTFDTPFDNVDTSKVGSVNIQAGGGIKANLHYPKFFSQSDFKDSMKRDGINYKVARIETPWDEINTVRAWAHRDNWENDDPINIEMYVSRDFRFSPYGHVWSHRMTLYPNKELPLDYSIDYLLNGTPYGKAGKLVQSIMPLVQAMILFLAEDLKPELPTAKQIAMKLMGPFANIVQQKLAQLEDILNKVQDIADDVQYVMDILEACKVIDEAPDIPAITIPGFAVPNLGIREDIIDFIKGLSPNIELSLDAQKDLFDVEIGVSDLCINTLADLLGKIYEVVPKEGISNVIFEFGE